MIQQPMYQDFSENPEFQQQMMLCPVRVVYDTQMFLPPGDQVQQNQYVINPQNPPPWIQNQVQNQVIYVQNVPNGYMQSFQPQIDQNQFQTYGYNMPQMLVQASQEPRPIQMIPANLMPNMNMNQRIIAQNIGTMANQVVMPEVQNQNVQVEKPTQSNHVANNQINSPHEVSTQINQQTFQADSKIPMQQSLPVISSINNCLQQRLPQFESSNIQIRPVHPQIINPNVQQNYQTIVAQKANVQQNYQAVVAQKAPTNGQQNFQTILTQRSPANTQQNYQNIVPQRFPPNAQPNIQTIVAQKVPPINKTNYQVVSGTGQPIYRAIQPRPNQINTNIQTVQQMPTQNIVYMNNIRRSNSTNTITAPSANPNYVKIDNSRKRKSESPDEIRNKILISNQNNIIIKQEPTSRPAVEIISNPTGASRTEHKMVVNSLQITALDTQNVKIKEELAKPVRNISLIEPKQMIRNKMINNVEAIQSLSNANIQDKLIRNTVFTQARGRLITDTEQQEPEILKNLLQSSVTQNENDESKSSTSLAQNSNVKEKLSEEKTEIVTEIVNKDVSELKKDVQDTKEIKTECLGNKETKDEKSFLLTHVLDGYVIQESNMAFPIRRPLKEKTMRVSTEAIKPKTEPEFEPKEEKKEKESERLLAMSQLQLKEESFLEALEPEDKENPFASVSPDSVKSWSVDQLVDHLKVFSWGETTLLLQDHEIDGESLFLVSKTQLTKIGISEEHATIICDFVKKS